MMAFLATGFGLFVCVVLFFWGMAAQLLTALALNDYKVEENTGAVLILFSWVITAIGGILGFISIILQIGLFFSTHH